MGPSPWQQPLWIYCCVTVFKPKHRQQSWHTSRCRWRHAVHQSKTTKTDGGCKETPGERGLYLSFTATMEHVRAVLLPLFTLTECIGLLENYITSCLEAIDWITGPHSIPTDVSLAASCISGGEGAPTDPGIWQMHHSNRKSEAGVSTNPIETFDVVFPLQPIKKLLHHFDVFYFFACRWNSLS